MSEWEDHCGEQGCEICCGNVMDHPATVQTEVEAMRAKLKQASALPNALLPTEEVVAKAVREEIVRQYRDDERGKCPSGANFYEEHVSPLLIARAAMRALAKPDEGVVE